MKSSADCSRAEEYLYRFSSSGGFRNTTNLSNIVDLSTGQDSERSRQTRINENEIEETVI